MFSVLRAITTGLQHWQTLAHWWHTDGGRGSRRSCVTIKPGSLILRGCYFVWGLVGVDELHWRLTFDWVSSGSLGGDADECRAKRMLDWAVGVAELWVPVLISELHRITLAMFWLSTGSSVEDAVLEFSQVPSLTHDWCYGKVNGLQILPNLLPEWTGTARRRSDIYD